MRTLTSCWKIIDKNLTSTCPENHVEVSQIVNIEFQLGKLAIPSILRFRVISHRKLTYSSFERIAI
ncbi:hypothetical protein SAMN04488057_107121 [Cyclobacterium lianum]|uniref:Uncharacterized protein n=1 Tax=Cyclobacterium lianum TaxID=388280 RepID=A0A1M7P801_9BACT|nr:hypothetical protein SAMN04488057_107121 [Cyclobacterium lianum]